MQKQHAMVVGMYFLHGSAGGRYEGRRGGRYVSHSHEGEGEVSYVVLPTPWSRSPAPTLRSRSACAVSRNRRMECCTWCVCVCVCDGALLTKIRVQAAFMHLASAARAGTLARDLAAVAREPATHAFHLLFGDTRDTSDVW